ncbi:MAG: RecX family transcriptional regulator [FCB group bacterium]|nr:RecX family transcriptional regulator [FCB group bacterium]
MYDFEQRRRRKPRKPVLITEKAADLLARRRLSRGELQRKLLQRKYDEAEIEELLDRYEDLGFLNDKELAFDRARYILEAKPVSRKYIIYELRRALISLDIAEAAAEAAYTGFTEEEIAVKAFKREFNKTKDKEKLWRRMQRLGFASELLRDIFGRYFSDDGMID